MLSPLSAYAKHSKQRYQNQINHPILISSRLVDERARRRAHAALLERTLREEKAADKKLTRLAESRINSKAVEKIAFEGGAVGNDEDAIVGGGQSCLDDVGASPRQSYQMIRPDHVWWFFTVVLSLALAMSIPPRKGEPQNQITSSEQIRGQMTLR